MITLLIEWTPALESVCVVTARYPFASHALHPHMALLSLADYPLHHQRLIQHHLLHHPNSATAHRLAHALRQHHAFHTKQCLNAIIRIGEDQLAKLY